MAARIIDGKAWADRIGQEVHAALTEKARRVRLDVILVGDHAPSMVYVRNKERRAKEAGMDGRVHRLAQDATQAEVQACIASLNENPEVHGILLQLPLPDHLDATPLVQSIAAHKDVDGLTTANAGKLALGFAGLFPCTPQGVIELLKREAISMTGKRALVIGRSQLVGKPLVQMLLAQHATVTVAHSKSKGLGDLCAEADILVAAAGVPRLVRGSWLKPGAVVIDVGIHRTEDGTLCGDVCFEEAMEVAGALTPVPGGVGPMTIAMLLSNTLKAAELSNA